MKYKYVLFKYNIHFHKIGFPILMQTSKTIMTKNSGIFMCESACKGSVML